MERAIFYRLANGDRINLKMIEVWSVDVASDNYFMRFTLLMHSGLRIQSMENKMDGERLERMLDLWKEGV